ncbi:MAG TPA: MOSC domain-containing protein [Acidimicrobiales bacterium]|nr:MOSC domain-containing protein [Acidimicrobiales bacterium]
MGEALGRIVSVNVGLPRTVEWHGRQVTSAIWREPVDGPAEIVGERLVGDASADLRVHGGTDKALYAYSTEDYAWWAGEMPDTTFLRGLFGENLTTEGIDLGEAVIGERWQIGTAVLEVSQPRFPCAKLGMRMGDAAFMDHFDQARRSGAYLRVVEPGRLEAGDDVVRIGSPPDHGIRIADVVDSKHGAPAELLERILALDIATDAMLTLARRGLAKG